MARHRPLPDEALLNYSREHLKYEIDMLRGTQALLAAVLRGALVCSWIDKNALIESWGLHLRNLIDFLFYKKPQPDDVIAADFLDDPGSWERMRRQLPESLRKARKRANKELAHLTANRKEPGDPAKEWEFSALTAELCRALEMFGKSASPAKLDRRVLIALR